jgi:5'-nucleotidase/UDP-sugar diphosphatase
VEEDSGIASLVSEYASRLGEEMEKTVGFASIRLDGERTSVRNRETNLGDLITDAMRSISGTDIALTNAGSIRASIDAGEITTKEILTALPFGGQLVTMNLTGRQLAGVFKRTAGLRSGSGGFLQLSGASLTIEKGEARDVRIAGEPLDEKRSYSVATNDFLASGGDGYSSFKQATGYYNTGLKISDVVIDYIRARDMVGKKVESRITRK